mmetsp:Transcript_2267/g.4129  ORF Transcript_2267/g.4129 Transcript_2267/m.4129 type:complete len:428 (+) Transcript_2267:147-1430(+)|eukprot:CAMPEP_0197662472 /NCGR_PEP_ID=MMETSP1338-20131121/53579_1 /TAXON_ID=43686 ORGANISM="Pelagodinium beii, Strain RCC1491" /NCGR_SAMPLE_ID=MMETSP1338 /ASSEMBLY_ACC=CAM_ASM_000754 /LENGTH=427 /DNA_ID=CAMNT_0043240345 /DNA_START=138 /DNA_END=1421 /DNA_ORIENTATION=+
MADLTSLSCAAESRRLVDDTKGSVGKNVDIEKLDNCSEVALGLLSTFLITIVLWFLALPFFDVVGFNWMRSWEREPGQISLVKFKENLLYDYPATAEDGIPAGSYEIMDANHDGYVVPDEYSEFMGSLTTPMNGSTATYTFKGLDADKDNVLTQKEFNAGLAKSEFYYFEATTTTTTLAAPAPVPAPPPTPEAQSAPASGSTHTAAPTVHTDAESTGDLSMQELLDRMGDLGHGEELTAFQAFDLDKDSFAAKGEFLKGLQQIQQPVTGDAAEGIFKSLDMNQDNVVESEEFFKAFQSKSYVSIAPPQVTTTSTTPNPLKTKTLQELGLNAEPISLETFTSRLGSVTPEEAFNTLDADKDNEINQEEMVAGAKAFAVPLTDIEAKYAQKGLDVTGDGKVVYPEMSDTMKFGNFFPTREQAEAARVNR